jgi:hypothetical protein
MTTANNYAIIDKIRALRARTEAAGCTEDEAMQAAAMIARLMSKYDLTDVDITAAEETGIGLGSEKAAQRTKHRDTALDYVAAAIARLTETRIVINQTVAATWRGKKATESSFSVYGMDADREMATYLMEVVRSAATRGWNEHSARTGQTGSAARAAFRIGVCVRVATRINEIAQEREDARKAATQTGNALIVRKEDLVDSLLPADIRTQRARPRKVDGEAYSAGQAYGNNIGLGRPVAGAQRAAGAIA